MAWRPQDEDLSSILRNLPPPIIALAVLPLCETLQVCMHAHVTGHDNDNTGHQTRPVMPVDNTQQLCSSHRTIT